MNSLKKKIIYILFYLMCNSKELCNKILLLNLNITVSEAYISMLEFECIH